MPTVLPHTLHATDYEQAPPSTIARPLALFLIHLPGSGPPMSADLPQSVSLRRTAKVVPHGRQSRLRRKSDYQISRPSPEVGIQPHRAYSKEQLPISATHTHLTSLLLHHTLPKICSNRVPVEIFISLSRRSWSCQKPSQMESVAPLGEEPDQSLVAGDGLSSSSSTPVPTASSAPYEDADPASSSSAAEDKLSPRTKSKKSWCFLLGLNAYNAPNNLALMTLGIILLPEEAKRMFPDNKAIMLGVLLLVSGITQLICPLVGLCTDRCSSKYGKRRPFM